MTRVAAREIAVHLIYELDFAGVSPQELLEEQLTPEQFEQLGKEEELYRQFPDEKQLEYIREVVAGVSAHRVELDGYIEKYAIGWSLNRIPKVAAAILRTALYEVLYREDVPDKAAVSAAVELAKGYEDEKVVAFINGILGSFMRDERAQ